MKKQSLAGAHQQARSIWGATSARSGRNQFLPLHLHPSPHSPLSAFPQNRPPTATGGHVACLFPFSWMKQGSSLLILVGFPSDELELELG